MSHRIVIVGGSAGELELATRLDRTLGKRGKAQVILVDANLTHIWRPLLHGVATGSLNPSEDELNYVTQTKWNHFEFQLGHMQGLDRAGKRVRLAALVDENGVELVPERNIAYDTLMIAVGSTTNDLGTEGAAEHCIFLDTRAQAERLHRQLLGQYLRAHTGHDANNSAVSTAIIGAGVTGVELAAELHHAAQMLAAYGLDRIHPEDLHISLVEADPRMLPTLPGRISQPTHQTLSRLGIRVMAGFAVSKADADGLWTGDGEFVPATFKVWAVGIRAPAFLKELDGLENNRINQLVVRPTLQTTRDDDIFAFGDCAACPQPAQPGEQPRNVPPCAQAAHQQASLLVKSLRARLEGKPLGGYHYRDYGSLISLLHFSAVGNLMGNLIGSVMLEGWLVRMFYVSLYRMHQIALYGPLRAAMLMLSSRLRSTESRLKLHWAITPRLPSARGVPSTARLA